MNCEVINLTGPRPPIVLDECWQMHLNMFSRILLVVEVNLIIHRACFVKSVLQEFKFVAYATIDGLVRMHIFNIELCDHLVKPKA